MEEQERAKPKNIDRQNIKDLENKIRELEKQLSAEREEKKYLSEALESQTEEHNKQIANIEKDNEAKVKDVISSYENKLSSDSNNVSMIKDKFDKEYEKQIKYINRRENELNKLLNINDNIIKSIESNAFLTRALQEYIVNEIMQNQNEEDS